MRSETKDTNPKDEIGVLKAPMSTVPAPVLAELGVAMLEGALKYGRHNYRAGGVRASVYYDATLRHLMAWWEGENIDEQSGISHVTKAIASLVVLRDAMMFGSMADDRPPPSIPFTETLNDHTKWLHRNLGNANPHHYTVNDVAVRPYAGAPVEAYDEDVPLSQTKVVGRTRPHPY